MADLDFDKGTSKTRNSILGPVTLVSNGFLVVAGEVATIDDAAAIVAAIRGAGHGGTVTFAVLAEDVDTQDEARAIKTAVRTIGHAKVNYTSAVPSVET